MRLLCSVMVIAESALFNAIRTLQSALSNQQMADGVLIALVAPAAQPCLTRFCLGIEPSSELESCHAPWPSFPHVNGLSDYRYT